MSPKQKRIYLYLIMPAFLLFRFWSIFVLHCYELPQLKLNCPSIAKDSPFAVSYLALKMEVCNSTSESSVEIQQEVSPVEQYCKYVDEITSDIYPDLDPLLVKAVIQHESRYNAEAYNPRTGVVGLMQINPKWHSARADKLGVDLKDPYGNILVGCDILNELCQSSSVSYALNVYAGGYTYANSYIHGTSPYEETIYWMMDGITNGSLVLGGG